MPSESNTPLFDYYSDFSNVLAFELAAKTRYVQTGPSFVVDPSVLSGEAYADLELVTSDRRRVLFPRALLGASSSFGAAFLASEGPVVVDLPLEDLVLVLRFLATGVLPADITPKVVAVFRDENRTPEAGFQVGELAV